MGLLRAFIAIEIPSSIQRAIQQATSGLHQELKGLVRWTAPENIHLTLKFLGDISQSSMESLTQLLCAEADMISPFEFHVHGFGSFPISRLPRVLWVGIQAPAGLEAMYRGIEAACTRLGYEAEPRGFSPHLTIGRVKQDISAAHRGTIRRALEAVKIDSLGTARVDSVHLFKSDLKPSGAVYTKLSSAPLNN